MTRETAFWCLVLVLGLAWGTVQWFGTATPSKDHAHETPAYLVPGGPQALTRIEIERAGHQHAFTRAADGRWRVEPITHAGIHPDVHDHDHGHEHEHEDEHAGEQGHATAQGTVASPTLEGLLRTASVMRVDRRLGPPGSDLSAFGLDRPSMSFRVFSSRRPGGLAVAVGGATPDGFGRYALEVSGGELIVLPGYQIENLVTVSKAGQRP